MKDPVRVRREKLGRYRCPHCAYHWTDYARDQAVARGRWEADNPLPSPHRVGFHLPAYLSAAVSLSEIRAAQLELEKTYVQSLMDMIRSNPELDDYALARELEG